MITETAFELVKDANDDVDQCLPASPLSRYHELITDGVLRSDDHQYSVVARLQKLHDDLRLYTPPPIPAQVRTQSFVRVHWH